jgi:hypothetical protein
MTSAGTVLRDLLDGRPRLSILRAPVTVRALVDQAFLVLARRRFVPGRRPGAVHALAGGDPRAAAWLTAAITPGEVLPPQTRRIGSDVADLVPRLFAESGADADELVETTEWLVYRDRRADTGRHFRQFCEQMAQRPSPWPSSPAAPGTSIGRALEAFALGDSAAAQRITLAESDERTAEVVERAFNAAVGACFDRVDDPAVGALARALGREEAAGLIAHAVDPAGPAPDAPPAVLWPARVAAFAAAVEAAGLFRREIAELIVTAER